MLRGSVLPTLLILPRRSGCILWGYFRESHRDNSFRNQTQSPCDQTHMGYVLAVGCLFSFEFAFKTLSSSHFKVEMNVHDDIVEFCRQPVVSFYFLSLQRKLSVPVVVLFSSPSGGRKRAWNYSINKTLLISQNFGNLHQKCVKRRGGGQGQGEMICFSFFLRRWPDYFCYIFFSC